MSVTFLILLGVVALLAFWVMGQYNSLVALRNHVKNAWAQINVQLNRRHDLIPNLVESVKGYSQHERSTLENLTKARSQAVGAHTVSEKARAEGELSSAIGRFMMVVENYPDLKANTNFLALQEELTSTENKLAFARQGYNDQVMFYNNKIQMFPSSVVASGFGFKEETVFQLENAEAKVAPKVSF